MAMSFSARSVIPATDVATFKSQSSSSRTFPMWASLARWLLDLDRCTLSMA